MIFDEPLEGATAFSNCLCPMCQAAILVARHCKLICERCGYVESCEDNFPPNPAPPSESISEISNLRFQI